MTAPLCASCARPVADQARLCAPCTDRLARDLADLAMLDRELQTTRLRQSRMGGAATGVLSRSRETPLPWDQNAAEAAYVLRSTVVAWVRVLVEEHDGEMPADTMQAMADTLFGGLERIRHADWADEMADEIADAVANARQAVDRHASKTYAGPCREEVEADDEAGSRCCLAELYVRPGAAKVTCPVCRRKHDVTERKAWLLAIARGHLATLVELRGLLARPDGEPFSRFTLASWVRRGNLVAHGKTADDTPLYRIGDAADLAYGRKAGAA